MMRGRIFFLLLLILTVIELHQAQPTEFPSEGDEEDEEEIDGDLIKEFGTSFPSEDVENEREKALEKLQKIFGITGQNERSNRRTIQPSPPQFMMELYNAIADPRGVTRGRNPYNARVVRSFIERDSSLSHFYLFDISGLEVNESVLEAELHLYRRRASLKDLHPSVLSSPYYLIRVYQVLPEQSLEEPDLHRLLNIHYVGAHASGWQVFNVKQAVLSWMNGAPNLGLLVTASTLFGDQVSVSFSRRSDNQHSKQPILVLFDDDGGHGDDLRSVETNGGTLPYYYKYDNSLEGLDNVSYKTEDKEANTFEGYRKREQHSNRESPFLQGSTMRPSTTSLKNEDRQLERSARSIHDERTYSPGFPKSMDIYAKATRRERMAARRIRRSATDNYRKEPFSTRRTRADPQPGNATECTRHELYVDFEEIGWSSFIIAPKGYSAYHCKGHCNFPLSQSQRPTNHATVQSIVHKLGLANDVQEPCCVPTKLLSASILYFDDNDNVILKMYEDMIADRCGCH